MTRLQIPQVGAELELYEDWKFMLYEEYRNASLATKLELSWTGNSRSWYDPNPPTADVTLAKGTILIVDRVYIRRASKIGSGGLNEGGEYNSITFRVASCSTNKKLKGARFWAKLHEVNQIVCTLVGETIMGGQSTTDQRTTREEKIETTLARILQELATAQVFTYADTSSKLRKILEESFNS